MLTIILSLLLQLAASDADAERSSSIQQRGMCGMLIRAKHELFWIQTMEAHDGHKGNDARGFGR
jgi:hypothetical protein